MSYHYKRVIPRDFFNEAKLLKCLGRLHLLIHDNAIKLPFRVLFDEGPFDIRQDPNDGSLTCLNYRLFLDGQHVELFTPLNSRESWPLVARYRGEEYYMFDGDGDFMPNFGVQS